MIFQDIVIIPMILVVPYLANSPEVTNGAGWKLLKSGLIILVFLVLARYLVPRLLRRIVHTRNQDLFLVSILGICLATAFITYELGLKLALGAFLAGLIVSESEYSYSALSKIIPLKKIFMSIFFISIGMMLQIHFFLTHILLILGTTLAVMLIKFLLIAVIARRFRLSAVNALILGLSLCQVGEFAFVLSKAGNEYSLLSADQYQVFLGVSILSMAISTYLIGAAPTLAVKMINFLPEKWLVNWNGGANGLLTDPDETWRDHLLIIGYGVSGKQIAFEARQQQTPYCIIDIDETSVGHARQQGETVYAGDARDPEILLKAGADKASVIAIAVSDAAAAEEIVVRTRKLNTDAYIVIRTLFISEIEEMEHLGADEIIPAQWEASIQMSKRVMASLQKEKGSLVI